MLEFILNDNLFDTIISFFLIINTIITGTLSAFKDLKSNHKQNDTNTNEKMTRLEIFKSVVIIINIFLFAILIIYFAYKYKFISYFSLFYYFAFIWIAFKLSNKNIIDLTYDNKMSYIQTSVLFLIFFSNDSTVIYLENFSSLSHNLKEYMVIIFLVIKIVFFIFCVIINFSILTSNIYIMFQKQINFVELKIKAFIDKTFELKLYNFYISNNGKNKKFLLIDVLIFIFLCPLSLLTYFVFAIFILIIRNSLKILLSTGNKIVHYFDNSSEIIKKTLKISTIFALILVYIITTYNVDIFTDSTRIIYELITTVILIPLIYDSIKQK